MLSLTGSILLGVILVVTYWIFRRNKRPTNFPPGPCGFPVFGYLPFLDYNAPHKSITKLSKIYGDVLSLNLGSGDVVYLNTYDAMKEAFSNPHIRERSDIEMHSIRGSSLFAKGKHHREDFIRHLKDFALEEAVLESTIGCEAEKLVLKFDKKVGKPFQVSKALNNTIVNIVWQMMASLQLNEDDPEFKRLVKNAKKAIEGFCSASLADFLTWSGWNSPCTIGSITKRDTYQTLRESMSAFCQKLIDEHEKTLDAQNPRDFIDFFLIKIKEEEEKCVENSCFTYNILEMTMLDLFLTSSAPTAAALKGAILLLSQHQSMQREIKKEIQYVTGGERRVCLKDRSKLPLLEAFILESHRHHSIPIFDLPHCATENTTIIEFVIPKDTVVIANMWAIHFDETYWKNPLKFDPSRFINQDGSVNYKNEEFMPLSISNIPGVGKRLVKAEFLLLGYLLQDFSFRVAVDASPVSFHVTKEGALFHMSPFDVLTIQTQTYNI